MENYYSSSIVLLLMIISFSCSEQTTGPIINDKQGEINAKVSISYTYQVIPPKPVSISLLRYVKGKGIDSLETKYTNKNGICKFKVDTGSYFIRPNFDNYYVEASTAYCEITSTNLVSEVVPVAIPRYYLYPDTLKLEVDTTFLGRSWASAYSNIGVMDTLECQFDLSSKPDWLYFEIDTNIFPPFRSTNLELNNMIGISKNDFPYKELPILLKFPYKNQFELDTLYISFKFRE